MTVTGRQTGGEMVDFGDNEIPWPRKGDDPFALTEDALRSRSLLIACLNFTPDPWGGMAEGFKRLADLGVAWVEQTGHDQDYLVHAIAFNYRHYVELALKEIIRDARRLLDEQGGVPETHNLSHLWNTAEPLLERIESGSKKTYRDVRGCLERFSDLDPSSEAFRYPVRRTGEAALSPDVKNLDLGQLRDVVTRLASFLDGATTHISVCLDYKADMAREYADSSW